MINAIIIDDEKDSIEALAWELELFAEDLKILQTFEDPQEAFKALPALNPDLVFLDIEMPNMNGFDWLKKVGNITFDVIFTTAYDEFAVKAFKVSAVDYLLKPIDEKELGKAIEKVKAKQTQRITQQHLEQLFQNLKTENPTFPALALPTMDGLEFVDVVDIIHCTSESNYTNIHLKSNETILVSKTLKEVEAMLNGHHFFRVHHSHLVHLIHVKKYVKGKGGYLVLKNGKSIPVARSKKEDLLDMF